MPNEKVLNLPLESEEIIAIILRRTEARLRADCFLNGSATYAGFSYEVEYKIKFRDMMLNRETLVWDKVQQGEPPDAIATRVEKKGSYSTADVKDSPNKVREQNDLPMPVQVQEGNRKVIVKRKVEHTGSGFGKHTGRIDEEGGAEE